MIGHLGGIRKRGNGGGGTAPGRRCHFTLVELVAILIVIVAVVLIVVEILQLFAPGGHREKARRINCAGNLKQIGLASLMYAGDHDGYFPNVRRNPTTNLAILNDLGLLNDGKVYGCPEFVETATRASAMDFVYIGSGLKDDNNNPTENSLAYDLSGNHPNNTWMNVLFIDGHVQGAHPSSDLTKFANNWPALDRKNAYRENRLPAPNPWYGVIAGCIFFASCYLLVVRIINWRPNDE